MAVYWGVDSAAYVNCGAKICYNNTTCFDEDEVNGAVGFACLW